MVKSKKLLILWLTVWVCVFSYASYKMWLEKPLETKSYVNEIIQLKVERVDVHKYDSETQYKLFVDGKYIIKIDSIKYVPYKRKERVDIIVKDINSDYVVTNWKRQYWEHDINKLMKYVTENIKNSQ